MLESLRQCKGREADDASLVNNDIKASVETSGFLLRTSKQFLLWKKKKVCSDVKKCSCELQAPVLILVKFWVENLHSSYLTWCEIFLQAKSNNHPAANSFF